MSDENRIKRLEQDADALKEKIIRMEEQIKLIDARLKECENILE